MKRGLTNTPKIVRRTVDFTRKEAPTIMSIGAVIGFGVTIFLALKSKPKADEIVAEKKRKYAEIDKALAKEEEAKTAEETTEEVNEEESAEEEKKVEKISNEEAKKLKRQANIEFLIDMGKVVWAPVAAGAVTVFLILGANHVSMRRLAYLGAAYEMKTGDLKKYREKAAEVVGEKKEEEIRNAVAKEEVEEAYKVNPEIIDTGKGHILYFDSLSGRFFRASKTAIEAAVNEVNRIANKEMFASLDNYYYELGFPHADFAEDFGYNGFNGEFMREPSYSYTEHPSGEPAIKVEFDYYLRYNG